jgi:hypothetical protein
MKIWAWMSTNPGITNRPLALIVRRASAAGSDGARNENPMIENVTRAE